ncbi:unnamed protein product, partial [Durusdinium trenchii]
MLVSCDCDDEFDAELRYHYYTFHEFGRLVTGRQFDPSIWRHQHTCKREPSVFKGAQDIAEWLRANDLKTGLGFCVPLRQAPPLGISSHLTSSPSQSEADDEQLFSPGSRPSRQSATSGEETSADEISGQKEHHELLQELHWQRDSPSKAQDIPSQAFPTAKEFLMRTMLQWKSMTITTDLQDVGWVLPSRHLRVWAKIPAQGRWLKFAFESQVIGGGVSATLQRQERQWILASKEETSRSEPFPKDVTECWFEMNLTDASSELRLGHGLNTAGPTVARVAARVMGEIRVCLQADQTLNVEFG